MAVSLAFGVLFATSITLILVPIEYLILDDFGRGIRRLFRGHAVDDVPPGAEAPAFDGLRQDDTTGHAAL